LIDVKVGAGGTANYLEGAAMSETECALALSAARAGARHRRSGCNVLAFGEMGIGNTASASLLTHCITGRRWLAASAAAPGWTTPAWRASGAAGAGTRHLAATAGGRRGRAKMRLRILARFGGFEIAMLAGAMLAAAEARLTLLIDGFIVTSALLVASRVAPAVLDYCVFAHCSNEAGHRRQLDWLGARPLLDLGLRLGEGTGAALALPLLQAACAFLNEMASFESAGVSDKTERAKQQLEYFFAALRFFTRLPTPAWVGIRRSSSTMRRATSRWSASSSAPSARR
jgi:nicotinate-nucleotide--dimethylbenzimidazole phosphoribosyltransferase